MKKENLELYAYIASFSAALGVIIALGALVEWAGSNDVLEFFK